MDPGRSLALETLDLLERRGGLRMDAVYARLFARAPETQALLIGDLGEQMRSFAAVFAALARNGVEPHRERLAALGARHARIGVEAGDHDALAAALLETIAEALGSDWIPARGLALRALYDEARRAMAGTRAMVGGERLELPTSSV